MYLVLLVIQLKEKLFHILHLQMIGHHLPSYLSKVQSTIEEIKLRLTRDDLPKVLGKFDQMYKVFVLHGLYKDFESVRN